MIEAEIQAVSVRWEESPFTGNYEASIRVTINGIVFVAKECGAPALADLRGQEKTFNELVERARRVVVGMIRKKI